MAKTAMYVLYHGGCPDGFGAAWAVHRHIGDRTTGGDVKYLPQGYSNPEPKTEPAAEILILDFSYPLETMLSLHRRHNGRVTLLDHHASAQRELAGVVPNCTFNLEESGATMAWRYAASRWANNEPAPELLLYVRDRDLWQWKLHQSQEVSTAIDSYEYDFSTWNQLATPQGLAQMKKEGRNLLRAENVTLNPLLANVVMREIAGLTVPAINSPTKASELANRMLAEYPEAKFAAVWATVPGPGGIGSERERWSLRSRPDFDVSKIAARFGGGGHPQAAGFTIETRSIPLALPQ